MDPTIIIIIGIAGAVAAVVLFVGLMVTGADRERVDDRLDALKSGGSRSSAEEAAETRKQLSRQLEKLGGMMGSSEEDKTKLQSRLQHAGIYSKSAASIFMGVKVILMIAPVVIAIGLAATNVVTPTIAGLIAIGGGIFGVIGPSFWLDNRKTARQTAIRRGLPDAMDVVVICMEGGLALSASIARVAQELAVAHPMLANELKIVEREVQMGKRTGEALKEFSVRSDLEEVRSLAGVIQQAEKYGASLAQALKIHAEAMRDKRAQQAEEKAQQAGTKIMIPTILFIFPALFLVILGPAVIRILRTFSEVN